MNVAWRVSNAASRRASRRASRQAGRHCSHGCSLSTQADSPASSLVSQPATHSSWVGGVGEAGPANHWLHCAQTMLWYCQWWHDSPSQSFCVVTGSPLTRPSLSLSLSCCVTEQRCSIIPGVPLNLDHMQEVWASSHADYMFTRPPPPEKALFYLQLHQLITFWLAVQREDHTESPGLINPHRIDTVISNVLR